jgi:hypothetical protein
MAAFGLVTTAPDCTITVPLPKSPTMTLPAFVHVEPAPVIVTMPVLLACSPTETLLSPANRVMRLAPLLTVRFAMLAPPAWRKSVSQTELGPVMTPVAEELTS